MPQTIVTLVSARDGGLADSHVTQAARLIRAQGVDGIEVDWLDHGRAADLLLPVSSPLLDAKLREILQNLGSLDVFVQPAGNDRKKKLLIADMDATIVIGETLDELAGHLGLKDKVAPITAQAMRGEIDFAEALRLRVGLLKGLPLQSLHDTVAHTRLSPGAERLVKTMRAAGARTVLISGGFDVFTHHAARMAGFEKNFGNRLGMAPDSLTGEVLLPIVDKDFKKRQLEEECRQLGISPALAVATGDGANDIPMLQAAGAGVGYYAKPAVVAATPFQIRHTDLSAILYLQGYRRAQFAL